jgi:hypothetical protein
VESKSPLIWQHFPAEAVIAPDFLAMTDGKFPLAVGLSVSERLLHQVLTRGNAACD